MFLFVNQISPKRSWQDLYTSGLILDLSIHSANGLREQSHDKGLSRNDRISSDLTPLNAFLATIEMSFPSRRISFNDGSGMMRSDVSAL